MIGVGVLLLSLALQPLQHRGSDPLGSGARRGLCRADFVRAASAAALSLPGCAVLPLTPGPALAADAAPAAAAPDAAAVSQLRVADYAFRLSYPATWEPSSKPVKTHLLESILKGPAHKAQLGVTVDPVKISSLEEFGSIAEVSERVLKVEEGRDGVQAVELRRAVAEPGSPTYYVIEYAVASSRGKKMYLCKYCIAQRKLYVLQTQAALDSYDADADSIRTQLNSIVASFVVGG